MKTIHVSDKGRFTLPVEIRKMLNIKPKSAMDIEVRNNEIVLKPVKSIRDLCGIFRDLVKDEPEDWETIRNKVEKAVAEEVVNEDRITQDDQS